MLLQVHSSSLLATACLLGSLALVVRAKPAYPEEGRALSSWSGWSPAPGLAMFASSSGDQDPWSSPSAPGQPPAGSVWKMGEDGVPRPFTEGSETGGAKKKKTMGTHKKKHHRFQESDEDSDYDEEDKGGVSRANASFNAWFPILLGYPGKDRSSSSSEENHSTSRGKHPTSSNRPSSSPGSFGSTPQDSGREGMAAVANSVNHGRSGVASSHAVVFAGEPDLMAEHRRTISGYYN